MPTAVETCTWLYLSGTEPGMTVLSSRPAQRRAVILPQESRSANATFWTRPDVHDTATAQDTFPPPEIRLTQTDMIVRQLCRLEGLEANWDGSGAAKPIPGSLNDARRFLRCLAPESVLPRATLHADGHAVLLFRAPDAYAELEFLGGNRIGFFARRGGQEWSDEIQFDGGTLPVGLSQIGFMLEQTPERAAA